MTLTQLRYLEAVDRHRHFGRAAAECGVTQPTLSIQLAKLERELGVELFDRTRTPVEPTDIGRLVIIQARRTLREAGRIHALFDESDPVIGGELRVGILPTLAPALLPALVPDLAEDYPGLTVRIEELRTEQIVERLESDLLDAGLVATRVEGAGLVERPLFEEPFVAYVSERHRLFGSERIDVSDLERSELWLLQEGHCFRDQVVSLCHDTVGSGEVTGPLHLETGSLETLRRLVTRSGGMTLLPGLTVQHLSREERKRVREFAEPRPSRLVRLVHPRGHLRRRAIEAFAGEVRKILPPELLREVA